MPETLTAVYRDGAFVPEESTTVPAGARVKLVVESVQSDLTPAEQAVRKHRPPTDEEWADFNALCDRMAVRVGSENYMTRDELHERR